MSLLRRIFGGKSFDELRAEGDAQLEAGHLGQAKLTYERALDRGKDAPEEARADVRERIERCLDGIAERRIEQGREHLEVGELGLAREELEGAIDTAVSERVIGEARRLIDGMEAREAVTLAEEVEVTDEEKLSAIAGSWEDEQDAEYAGYGDELEQALVALYDERYEEARELLEVLIEEAEEPRYLWLEVGRARVVTGDTEAGAEALRTFLGSLEEGEGGEARLTAHRELAWLLDEQGDEDGALAELQAAVEEMEEDPRPFLTLGAYLRRKGHAAEAVEVLEAAIDLMGEERPNWRILQELGLAHADAGNDERAVEQLESVIAMMVARKHYDFPPETAVPLARLHEKLGKTERAADLYRSLTRGTDRANHLAYHLEAARLLSVLELDEEARRMMQRATALAGEDAEALAAVAARRDELGIPAEGPPEADGGEASDGEPPDDDDEAADGEPPDDDEEAADGEPPDDDEAADGEPPDDDEAAEGEPQDDDGDAASDGDAPRER